MHNIQLLATTISLALLCSLTTPAGAASRSGDDLTPRFAPGTRILFQGDSITDGGRGRSEDPNHILGQDYAYIIAATCGAHFPDSAWVFLNRGISGNKVTDLAARWQTDALDLKPDILSVLVGVNDAGSVVNSSENKVGAAEYERVYDQILAQAVAANPNVKLVLCEPFVAPVGHYLEHPTEWSTEIKLRQAVVDQLAAKYHAPVVRFQDMFDAAITKHPNVPITYWIWDGIHPTYAGHQLMAEEWLRTVNRFYYGGK